jgi:hypothetical protein
MVYQPSQYIYTAEERTTTLAVVDAAGLVPFTFNCYSYSYVYDLPTVAMHASEVAIHPASREIDLSSSSSNSTPTW